MLAYMPIKSTSRRRTAEGELVQIRLHDRQQLIALRMARPDEKGRPGRSLSQRQVASHIGISHGHYGDLEAGRRHPSLAVGQRLADFFEVTLDVLCEVVPIEPGPPSDARGSAPEMTGEGAGGHEDEAPVPRQGDGLQGG
jgi:DNA-binding XRE family transcriptional regulator